MISVFLNPLLQTKIKQDKQSKKALFISDLLNWRKTNSKLASAKLLLFLKPTIDSALKSFAPGQLLALRIQAAKIALNSLLTYDTSRNILPSTYVFNNLQRLNRIRRLRLNIIHIPLGVAYQVNIINKKSALLLDLLGRLPTTLLLADAIGMSLAKLDKIMTNNRIINDTSAVSKVTGQSLMSKKDVTDLDYIKYVYSSVGPILQKILLWSTGLHGKPVLSNQLIASKLKLSPGAVSQRKLKIQQTMSLLRSVL